MNGPATVRVLVVEPDASTAAMIGDAVRRQGALVTTTGGARLGLRLFFDERPKAVVLAERLAELDGWQLLERIRDLSDVPVLMVTDRVVFSERADCLAKPFTPRELRRRLGSLFDSVHDLAPNASLYADSALYEDKLLRLDAPGRLATTGGTCVSLSKLEFQLLEALVTHSGTALTNEQLLDLAWRDPSGVGPKRVKFVVLRLRRKLGWLDDDRSPLQSIHGYGYRYAAAN